MKSTLVRIKTKVNQNLYEIYFLFFPQPPPSLSFLPIGVFSSLLAAASITRVQCTIFQRLLDMSPDFQLISVLMKMGDSWCADFQLMCGGDLRHVQTLCSPQAGFSNGDISSSVQFSRSVVSNSLRPHESQHARPPCPSPTPGVHPDSRPSTVFKFLLFIEKGL